MDTTVNLAILERAADHIINLSYGMYTSIYYTSAFHLPWVRLVRWFGLDEKGACVP